MLKKKEVYSMIQWYHDQLSVCDNHRPLSNFR